MNKQGYQSNIMIEILTVNLQEYVVGSFENLSLAKPQIIFEEFSENAPKR